MSGTEWTVAVATYGRAGRVSTDKVVRNCKIVAPASQIEEYAKYKYSNGAELVEIPDEKDGNLPRKRNWIMDQFPGNLLILDDDYLYIGMVEKGIARNLTPDQIDDLLATGFELARDLGTVMWGLNQQVDPKFYREYAPFSMLSPILGPFQAFCDCPLRYDPDFWLKEDYDLWLQVVQKYGKTLRFNKFHYMVNHISLPGGQVSKRTMVEEKRQNEALQKKWGKGVVQIRKHTINPRVRVPKRGI